MKSGRLIRIVLKGLAFLAWWLLFLFGSAGKLTWSRGWICTVLYLAALYTIRAVNQRLNPGLLQQRQAAIREHAKSLDKIFMPLFLSLTIVQPIVAGLDFRFHGSYMPFWTVYPAIVNFTVSAMLITWVLVKNPQAESSRPYRLVRHPMYVGVAQLYQAMAVILGSIWNMGLAALVTILFLWRTAVEDQTLRRELPGYEEYTKVTRYRAIRGIW